MVKEMKQLIKELNAAAKEYYSGTGREIMSDKQYDEKYDRLVALESASNIVLANSPTKRVGYEVVTSLKKVTHEYPALSLDKTKDRGRLSNWLNAREGVLSWKCDGLTTVLAYNGGNLISAVTRGNGVVGEDVTHNASYITGIPLKIPFLGQLVLRGETVISYENFSRINDSLDPEDKYKNPRNLAAGSLRLFDSEKASKRCMEFKAFELVKKGEDTLKSVAENFVFLKDCGFDVVEHNFVNSSNVITLIEEFEKKISTNPYPTDGLVLTYDDIEYGKSLGTTGKFPKYSIAFKWNDEAVETILRDVEWSASRTGLLNPVAVFDPIEIEGTTVSRASLHNVSYIMDMDLRIGDKITVYKANMIIPQIDKNLSANINRSRCELANYKIIDHCPVCNSITLISGSKESKVLVCDNENCSAKKIGAFVHFCERDCMDLFGFAESTIETLVSAKYVQEFADFYQLDRYPQIADFEGFGKKSYEKMLKSSENAKNTDFVSFLHAMGISNVGKGQAKLIKKAIEKNYSSFMDENSEYSLVDCLKKMVALKYDFTEIEGIGYVIANSLITWVNEKLLAEDSDVLRLLEVISVNDKPLIDADESLAGKTFVITGSLNHFTNREALKTEIENKGGKVSGSVSKNTTALINNDLLSSSGKNKKASELGILSISEEEFIKTFL